MTIPQDLVENIDMADKKVVLVDATLEEQYLNNRYDELDESHAKEISREVCGETGRYLSSVADHREIGLYRPRLVSYRCQNSRWDKTDEMVNQSIFLRSPLRASSRTLSSADP